MYRNSSSLVLTWMFWFQLTESTGRRSLRSRRGCVTGSLNFQLKFSRILQFPNSQYVSSVSEFCALKVNSQEGPTQLLDSCYCSTRFSFHQIYLNIFKICDCYFFFFNSFLHRGEPENQKQKHQQGTFTAGQPLKISPLRVPMMFNYEFSQCQSQVGGNGQ